MKKIRHVRVIEKQSYKAKVFYIFFGSFFKIITQPYNKKCFWKLMLFLCTNFSLTVYNLCFRRAEFERLGSVPRVPKLRWIILRFSVLTHLAGNEEKWLHRVDLSATLKWDEMLLRCQGWQRRLSLPKELWQMPVKDCIPVIPLSICKGTCHLSRRFLVISKILEIVAKLCITLVLTPLQFLAFSSLSDSICCEELVGCARAWITQYLGEDRKDS